MVAGGKLSPKFLDRFSLSLAFADLGPVAEDTFLSPISTATGPGGRTGVLLCALPTNGDKPERLGYYPDLQNWEAVEEDGQTCWVGTDKEQPIRPVDLVRKSVIPDYVCDLPGGKWSIPVIRNYEGGTGLPKDWRWNGNGEVTEIVQATYRGLWDEFAGVVDLYFGENEDEPAGVFSLSPAEAMQRCAQVLGVNYRFGRVEQNLTGVIGSETWMTILACAVDLPTFRDVFEQIQQGKQKKSDGEDDQEPRDELPNTSPGPPGDSPDTDQAEAS
ncbi:MAG: hypothetical protein ACYSWU_01940 [Planctomycetota bacterium]|jgi:hypothetical protein